MDMNNFNKDIMENNGEKVDEGPRFPDGDYVLAVTDCEEKTKYPQAVGQGETPRYAQVGLWVTFLICEGPKKGKDHKQYFGMVHPTSLGCVNGGQWGLKRLYKAIDYVPTNFEEVFGKRFIGTLKSKYDKENIDYPWSTQIDEYNPCTTSQGQSFDQAANNPSPENTQGQINNAAAIAATAMGGNVINTANGPVDLNKKVEIDEIPF